MANEDIGGSVVRGCEDDLGHSVVDFQVSAVVSTSALATAFSTVSTAASAAKLATKKIKVLL